MPLCTSGKWKCLKCSREFSSKSNANRHYRDDHLTFEKLNCELCGTELSNFSSLQKHLKKMHGLRYKDFKNRVMPTPRP